MGGPSEFLVRRPGQPGLSSPFPSLATRGDPSCCSQDVCTFLVADVSLGHDLSAVVPPCALSWETRTRPPEDWGNELLGCSTALGRNGFLHGVGAPYGAPPASRGLIGVAWSRPLLDRISRMGRVLPWEPRARQRCVEPWGVCGARLAVGPGCGSIPPRAVLASCW